MYFYGSMVLSCICWHFSQITEILQLLISPWNYAEKQTNNAKCWNKWWQWLVPLQRIDHGSAFYFLLKGCKRNLHNNNWQVWAKEISCLLFIIVSSFLLSRGLCRKATMETIHVELHTQETQLRTNPPSLHSHVSFSFLFSPFINTAFVSGDYMCTQWMLLHIQNMNLI